MRDHRTYRKIWEKMNNKKIPIGYHIHHLDGDKTNNNVKNLVCVSPKEHFEIHRENFELY